MLAFILSWAVLGLGVAVAADKGHMSPWWFIAWLLVLIVVVPEVMDREENR